MAHVGRSYKLHKRRDLCIGCLNNRRAIPKDWLIDWIIAAVGPPPRAFNIQRLPLYLMSDEWSAEMAWETAELYGPQNDWLSVLTLDRIDIQEQCLWFVHELYADGDLVLKMEQRNMTTGACGSIGMGPNLPARLLYINADYWGPGDAVVVLTGSGKRWHEP